MLGIERRQYIFNLIQERGSITVTRLSSLCEVGEETIRRDLNKMASDDLIEKIYGGATIKQTMHKVIPTSIRKAINTEIKKKIAQCCTTFIENGDTIFLDGSTTALEIASKLKKFQNLIIITNAVEVQIRLTKYPNIKVIGIGGTMRHRTGTFVGTSSVKAIGNYYADKAFISCDGADLNSGVTDANEQEAEIRKAMLRQSRTRILVFDKTKIDKTSFASISEFQDIDIAVTDDILSDSWISFLNDKNVLCKTWEDKDNTKI